MNNFMFPLVSSTELPIQTVIWQTLVYPHITWLKNS